MPSLGADRPVDSMSSFMQSPQGQAQRLEEQRARDAKNAADPAYQAKMAKIRAAGGQDRVGGGAGSPFALGGGVDQTALSPARQKAMQAMGLGGAMGGAGGAGLNAMAGQVRGAMGGAGAAPSMGQAGPTSAGGAGNYGALKNDAVASYLAAGGNMNDVNNYFAQNPGQNYNQLASDASKWALGAGATPQQVGNYFGVNPGAVNAWNQGMPWNAASGLASLGNQLAGQIGPGAYTRQAPSGLGGLFG